MKNVKKCEKLTSFSLSSSICDKSFSVFVFDVFAKINFAATDIGERECDCNEATSQSELSIAFDSDGFLSSMMYGSHATEIKKKKLLLIRKKFGGAIELILKPLFSTYKICQFPIIRHVKYLV